MAQAAMHATGTSVVYVTVPSMEVAEDIASAVVNPERRLAACVNIVPGAAHDAACAYACTL